MKKCKKCGNSTSEGNNSCSICKNKIKEDSSNNLLEEIEVSSKVYHFDEKTSKVDYRELQNCYTHKPSLFSKSFSINTFIFGFLYYWYRKMYLLGFLLLLFELFMFSIYYAIVKLIVIISSFLGDSFVLILETIMTILFLIIWYIRSKRFSQDYRCFVAAKVSKIVEKNPNKDNEILKVKCAKKGGISYLLLLLILLVVIYVSFYL